jgi:hypothetical protein
MKTITLTINKSSNISFCNSRGEIYLHNINSNLNYKGTITSINNFTNGSTQATITSTFVNVPYGSYNIQLDIKYMDTITDISWTPVQLTYNNFVVTS